MTYKLGKCWGDELQEGLVGTFLFSLFFFSLSEYASCIQQKFKVDVIFEKFTLSVNIHWKSFLEYYLLKMNSGELTTPLKSKYNI